MEDIDETLYFNPTINESEVTNQSVAIARVDDKVSVVVLKCFVTGYQSFVGLFLNVDDVQKIIDGLNKAIELESEDELNV
jgi:hypothetical protein